MIDPARLDAAVRANMSRSTMVRVINAAAFAEGIKARKPYPRQYQLAIDREDYGAIPEWVHILVREGGYLPEDIVQMWSDVDVAEYALRMFPGRVSAIERAYARDVYGRDA